MPGAVDDGESITPLTIVQAKLVKEAAFVTFAEPEAPFGQTAGGVTETAGFGDELHIWKAQSW